MLTASIVTYRTPLDELRRCLDSLFVDGVDRVYIVDNSPEDSLAGFFTTEYGDRPVKYIRRADNPGFGAAHNVAIRRAIEAGAEYHLVINSDVYFGRNTLKPLLDRLESGGDAGMIQPRIVYPDGRDQFSSRLLPTPLDLFGRRFLPEILTRRRNRRYLLADRSRSAELNIPYHQGSFLLFKVSCLKEIGLFDERFFMYPEDIDITRRMHERYATVYFPGVTVVHAHRASSYRSLRMLRIHLVNIARYFNKWGWFFDSRRRRFNREAISEMCRSLGGK